MLILRVVIGLAGLIGVGYVLLRYLAGGSSVLDFLLPPPATRAKVAVGVGDRVVYADKRHHRERGSATVVGFRRGLTTLHTGICPGDAPFSVSPDRILRRN